MMLKGFLTLLALIGCFALIIAIIIGLVFAVKWLDNKIEDKPAPKWLIKLDKIMENVVGFMILGVLFVTVFYALYYAMWN